MKLLSLDIGDKRIGTAVTDPDSKIVFGLTVIERKNRDKDLQEIKRLVDVHEIEKIVVGIPLTDDNRISTQGKKIVRFVSRLKKKVPVPIVLWDERYSSREAAEILVSRGESLDDSIDRVAAAVILQRYIDATGGDS
ncbi:MAG: hypothetical protein A3F16_05815 [Deltaproteobacteria bacterium RIFCSPHIGHO2_12_FULL_43_9]|nr:MAG: hypothetical protein A3F16_05815 [Deltaproteobacteria bacterium RIFCSPHIGHO2_12_FULL_43_9]